MLGDDEIPIHVFGPVPELFYGLVGRVVMLSSLLEMRMLMLRSTLEEGSEHEFAAESASQLVAGSLRAIDRLDEAFANDASEVVRRVDSALRTRNEIVHSVWPQPTLNEAYGWRGVGPRLRESERDAYASVTVDEDVLRALIRELVSLVEELNRLILAAPHAHT